MAVPRKEVSVGIVAIVWVGLVIVGWFALPTQQGPVALTVLAVAGGLASWKRPPTTDATGRRGRPTTVVNAVAGVGLAAVPIGIVAVGLTGGRSAATVVLGIGFAVFGFVAFALYSAVWVGTKRTTLAATVALIIAGLVSLACAVPPVLDQLAGRNPF